jgi:GTP-binding protein
MDKENNKNKNSGVNAIFRKVKFLKSAEKMTDLPNTDLSEIAFAGRSNVGKSSLLNALAGIKRLAKVSNTPGRTQLINYFSVNDELLLVDLPGYGYAKASKTKVAQWNMFVNKYLQTRANLRLVLILIDSRHGVKDTDREIMAMLDAAAVSYQIVLTKLDKLRASETPKIGADFSQHAALLSEVIQTSSGKGTGIEQLRGRIAEFRK